MFESIFTSLQSGVSVTDALISILASLGMGFLIALTASLTGKCNKSFLISLVVLPAIVQAVIMMVNGNVGTGVAVVGAFSLVRFRSLPGTARDICLIFLSMAIGLCNAMGYVTYALLAVVLVAGAMLALSRTPIWENKEKHLRITVPEELDFTDMFSDLFAVYTNHWKLESIKTTNMGTMYDLRYTIELKDTGKEKELIDAMRCRNGNLTIICASGEPENQTL